VKKEKSSRSGVLTRRKWSFLSPEDPSYLRIRRKSDGSFSGAYQKVFKKEESRRFHDQVCDCGEPKQSIELFVRQISHELNTPVTSLRLVAQIQKRKLAAGDPSVFDEKSMARWVDLIDRQTARLNRIIAGFSRKEEARECEISKRLEDESKSARACYDANESH